MFGLRHPSGRGSVNVLLRAGTWGIRIITDAQPWPEFSDMMLLTLVGEGASATLAGTQATVSQDILAVAAN
jgi:hypothetical protein